MVNVQIESASSAYEDHLVIANGIVTGDLFVQRSLERRDASSDSLSRDAIKVETVNER